VQDDEKVRGEENSLDIEPLALRGEDNAPLGSARSRLHPNFAAWLFGPRMALSMDPLSRISYTQGSFSLSN